uniref:Uncharacterized protein n=1 Tax=Globisporangium ultimum (strain ATCC 200006 / CBS 805.95 / DAOM BR144) TaxID=431595 RepID=K3WHU1_GLOUD
MSSSTTVVLQQRCADDAALSSRVLGASSACCTSIPSGGDDGSVPSHERIISAKAAATARGDKNSSSSTSLSSSSPSRAMTVLTAVERSLLRTLAFIFYQLDRNQAKYCASSILQWYFQLQTQLPLAAVDSLERVAESVIALADAKFTKFWLSLLEKELDDETGNTTNSAVKESRIDIGSYEEDAYNAVKLQADEERHQREKTFVKRLYQHVYFRIQSLFSTAGNAASSSDRGHTQTPCTSPIDGCDESHFQPHRKRRRYPTYAHHEDSEDMESSWSPDSSNHGHDMCSDDEESEEEDIFEPGWAVEYMEQESMVPNEVTRRMHQMMHSTIPLNLFQVTVTYNSDQADDAGGGGFVGVISPESFPPTPITRDLQTQRMNCYTVSVLDHATLALRLLEANCSS